MALDNPSYFTVEGQQANGRMGNVNARMESFPSPLEYALSSTQQVGSHAMRALLRSVSSNSADSNQELLVLGEPRLSDMAPEVAIKTVKGEPRRSNSLKTKSEMHNGVKYSALATDDILVDTDDEEVFLTGDSARYYNTSVINGRRRHSIGTFMSRDRSSIASSSKSFKEDRPQALGSEVVENVEDVSGLSIIDEHSLRHASYPRKRCIRCTGGTIKRSPDMDDILIISFKNSETVTSWVNYFTSYFEQAGGRQIYRKPFKVQHLGIEDIVDANGDVRYIAEKTAGVKLQLVVICPNFLEHISLYPDPASALDKILMPDRTLALLLGVTEDEIKDEHKNVFPMYAQWQRLSVDQDQDEKFTKEFLTIAMAIFLKVWKHQSSVINQEKAQFSVSPKKIRQGQSSFVIMLTYPLQKEDVIKISIERNNELTEIKSVKRRNPYTLKVIVPDVLTEISAIVHVLVEKNGSIIGSRPIKCESKLRELEQILRSITSPVEFMCQTLGFNPQNKEQLDNYLVLALQKNLPPNFNLLNIYANIDVNLDQKYGMSKEFPTLLHFAAKFGLEKLAIQLLECPGGDSACEIKNSNDMLPSEIASDAGHIKLSHILKGYMEMNEFTTMCTKLKEIRQEVDKPQEYEEAHYLIPRSINDCYKICPPPRPVTALTPSPTTERPPSPLYLYMAMNSAKNKQETTEKKTTPNSKSSQESINVQSRVKSPNLPVQKERPKNLPAYEDKFQKELLEIMNDFKNNVHSITQAEKLVDEWKNRNDVQKSFKEKQEQLNELRVKYHKMQIEMKNDHKSSPFDAVTKLLFSWRKHKEEDRKCEVSTPTTEGQSVITNNRPISSLSLQSTSSSGSSGRISTISGCSIGDSGTHSDHEDRKITTPIDESFKNDLNKILIGQNYMIPPAPKPIKLPTVNKCPAINKCPTIEERPPQPTPRPESDQYYIQVPPSGLPVTHEYRPIAESDYLDLDVNSHNTHRQSNDEYMNVPSTLQQSSETMRDSHDYMNMPM